MKVLLISPLTGVVGGISIWTDNILHYLSKQDDVEVELCDFSRKIAGQMISNPISKIWRAVRDYLRLTRYAIASVNRFDGEIIHLCSSASYLLLKDYLILRAARKKKIRTCIHYHFGRIPDLAKKRNWEWNLLQKVSRHADMLIVMDRMSYKVLENANVGRVSLLPNPLSDKVKKTISEIAVDSEERLLLFAGHCIPTKGIFELMEACRQIPDIRLRMIGAISPEIKKELLLLSGNNGWLEILGQVSHQETIRQMKSCDIFVLPTYTEGFPNVILESMACGCPIIATKVGAIPEMLEEEHGTHFGILIEPRNVTELKSSIEILLSDSVMKKKCGENAQRRVHERYGIQVVGKKLIDIWKLM